jgi:hypothetical protein
MLEPVISTRSREEVCADAASEVAAMRAPTAMLTECRLNAVILTFKKLKGVLKFECLLEGEIQRRLPQEAFDCQESLAEIE